MSPFHSLVVLAIAIAASALSQPTAAQEPVLSSRIESVSLFKNGLALIERRATPTAGGTFQLDAAPSPIHGTMWIEGDRRLIARVGVREREIDSRRPNDLQDDYAGRTVTVHLQDLNHPVEGVVRKIVEEESNDEPARLLHSTRSVSQSSRFLVLDTAAGEALVDMNRIVFLQAKGRAPSRRKQSVLLLQVAPEAKNKPIVIRYLAMGLSWAPSYHVELLGKARLRVSQTAILRNEITDLDRATVRLISGFPNIRFRNVTSPLSPRANWRTFFEQLGQSPNSRYGGVASNSIAMQQVVFNNRVAPSAGPVDLSAIPSGDGVDLHYESIGKHSLAKDESLQLEVGTADADYSRIVEWLIPDTHDNYGNRVSNDENSSGDAWDALQFRNPLDMPMTTGPATITEEGRFNGQTISHWVNRGEQTTLKVTKALSIRTVSIENEKGGVKRDRVYFGGRSYERVTVEGRVSVGNNRAEAVELVIRRRFSGELVSADGDPKKQLLQEGAYSINRRNELVWTLQLKPGEKVQLNYEYQLMERR